METKTVNIPVLQKSKMNLVRKDIAPASSCCTPKIETSVCCTPSIAKEDNSGACCPQPEDGSSCCNK